MASGSATTAAACSQWRELVCVARVAPRLQQTRPRYRPNSAGVCACGRGEDVCARALLCVWRPQGLRYTSAPLKCALFRGLSVSGCSELCAAASVASACVHRIGRHEYVARPLVSQRGSRTRAAVHIFELPTLEEEEDENSGLGGGGVPGVDGWALGDSGRRPWVCLGG